MNHAMARWLPILCLAASLLFVTISSAESDSLKGLSGPPFSDPSQIQNMPEDWIKQPVKYEKSAGDADLVLSLDQHLYDALLPVIQEYAKKHRLKIAVNEGTCGITFGALVNKTADIGGFCCPPDKTDRLPGLKFHTLGIDAKALLVHPDNPIDNVSIEQARQIFMGEIHRWSELSSSDGKKGTSLLIQPVTRLHCKLRPGHWRLLLDSEDLFAPGIQDVGAIPDMISQVASNPGAIGYEVLWNTIRYKDKGKVKALRINGYSPYEAEHLISLKYPLYRVYNLTTWEGKGLEKNHARQLATHLLQHAEKLGKEHNIIPASRLRKAGWKFRGNELIGEPDVR
ncbi:MAG: hypothetical protein HY757_00065 [Nitrospirae bacterium]|nr:hypothetical protein [Nitrospirota bacterium]